MPNEQCLSDKQRFQEALLTLNEVQRKSVLSDATTLQILAGPGSGKTRVLTFRVAYLVLEKGIYPNQIVVVTFTNKAANEMKERLITLIGEGRTNQLLIGTFHAICSRLLRKYSTWADLDPKFTICDTDQSKEIIKNIQNDKETPIDAFTREKMKPGAILGIISKAKSKGDNEHKYMELYGDQFRTKNIAIIFMAYEKELRRQNLVDFDNLLLFCCNLLRIKSDVLSRVKCILVDEYQDTNIVQYDLIKLMAAQVNDKTLTIVGDPDQSIFGWRSAEPKNFNKMAEEFKETESINMEQNYRSTGTIIKSAMHVIKQDVQRIDKNLYTNNPVGIPISLISTSDPETQAAFVATEIKKALLYSKGLIEYKDIAVLMRMNAFSRELEHTFRMNKIPFTMVGGERFFDRIEVKDMISYLLFAYNPKNITAFSRIINVPRRQIGDVWMKRILELNRDSSGDTMLETLDKIVRQQTSINFTSNIRNNLKKLYDILDETRNMIRTKKPIANILSFIYEATDYFNYLKDTHFQDHEARKLNLSELLNIAKENEQGAIIKNQFYDEDGNEFDDLNIVYAQEDNSDSDENQMDLADFHAELVNRRSTKKGTSVKSEPGIKAEPGIKSEPRDTGLDEAVQDTSGNNDGSTQMDIEDDDLDPVNDFLEYCVLSSNQKEIDEAHHEGGKVTIATMHSAKGLEWPMVFVVTCNEGVIPHSLCEHVEEEGRLLYVAMTRSKFFLYCISPRERNLWGATTQESRSHFLLDMHSDLYISKIPEWDNEVRSMLAETINRPAPDEDDFLTTKRPNKEDGRKREYPSSQPMYTDNRFGVNGSRADLSQMGGFLSASGRPFSAGNKKFYSSFRYSSTQPPAPVKSEFDASNSSQIPNVTAAIISSVEKVSKRKDTVAPPIVKVKTEFKNKNDKKEPTTVKREPRVKEESGQKRKKLEELL